MKLSELHKKYEAFCKNILKSHLRYLKSFGGDPFEIKVASRLLRCKLSATKHRMNESQVDRNIKKNFWDFVKSTFKQGVSPLPCFDEVTCPHHH